MSKSSITTRGNAMVVKREDLDAGRVELGDVVTGERIPAVHPGELLSQDFLEPFELSVYALAKALKVPRSRINDVVRGRRSITADTALRLGRYFGTTPEFWVTLQARYDLEVAKDTRLSRIAAEVAPRAA